MSVKGRLAGRVTDAIRLAPRPLNEALAAALTPLLFAGFERRTALDNLARVFPDWSRARRWRTALGAYRQMARSLVEFLHARRYTDADILDRVRLDNEEALATAYDQGRGALLLTGHFGNWEWLARRVAAAGYPLAVVYKDPKDPELAERMLELRTASGFETIEHENARAALQWLKRGGVLGIVMDQEPSRPEDGTVAPLLGRPTLTHVGPFRLARMTGAPVFTVFARREGPGSYCGRFEPLAPSADPDLATAMAEDAAAFNARLAREICERPDHWLWMYGRWRRLSRLESPTA